MKVRMTESELRMLIKEAVSFDERSIDMVKYLANKPGCAQYLNKQVLPDSVLAIFFGDQLLGAGAVTKPSQGMLQKMISKDTIAKKIQTPGAVERATKIKPENAQRIRDALAFAIDYAFGAMSEPFCQMIAASVEYATKLMAAFGIDNDLTRAAGLTTAGGAAAAAAARKVSIDIGPELSTIYTKVSQTEYFGKLNKGRITGVNEMDFFFFPFSMGALSSGDPNQLSTVVLEADLKALKEKIENVKAVGKFKNFFEEFFNAAFFNPVMKSSKGAANLCSAEIKAITDKLQAEGAESLYEKLSNATKEDFEKRAREHIMRFKKMMTRLPQGQELLQLFSKYSLI